MSRDAKQRHQDGADQDGDAGDSAISYQNGSGKKRSRFESGPNCHVPAAKKMAWNAAKAVSKATAKKTPSRTAAVPMPTAAATMARPRRNRLLPQPPADHDHDRQRHRIGQDQAAHHAADVAHVAALSLIQDRLHPVDADPEVAAQQQVAEHRGGGPIDGGQVGPQQGRDVVARLLEGHERRDEEQQRSGQQHGGGHGQSEQQHQPGRGTARRTSVQSPGWTRRSVDARGDGAHDQRQGPADDRDHDRAEQRRARSRRHGSRGQAGR